MQKITKQKKLLEKDIISEYEKMLKPGKRRVTKKQLQKLMVSMFERQGWKVYYERTIKYGGIEVIATKNDILIGTFTIILYVRNYKGKNKIGIRDVKHLRFSVSRLKANKGILVSLNEFTQGALCLLNENVHKMSKLDAEDMNNLIFMNSDKEDDGKTLPF